MSEFWLEANIQPRSPQDADRVLVEHIKRIVTDLQQTNAVQTWHFLRENENWRGQSQLLVPHIRFRVRAPDQPRLAQVQSQVTGELDALRSASEISDYYYGCHGTPNQDYFGEAGFFDEQRSNPEGWRITQDWLQAGSEVALLIIEGRLGRVGLSQKFHFNHQIHFVCDQMGKPEGICHIAGRTYHATTEGDDV
jgi:hypothetical protein